MHLVRVRFSLETCLLLQCQFRPLQEAQVRFFRINVMLIKNLGNQLIQY